MLDRKMTQVLVLVAAVAVAGCTALPGGGEQNGDEPDFRITQNDGLSISFQSLSNEYLEDDQIVLELSLQNTGEKEATGIRTELFGASFLIGTSADRTPSTSLQGVDRAAEQEGQSTSAIWRVQNPVDLDEGDSRSYPAGVRVLYDYGTTASASYRAAGSRAAVPMSPPRTLPVR